VARQLIVGEILMSEKNKEILKQANAAMVEGDYEGFLSHCTEELNGHSLAIRF
jgi:hypothetical protein